MRVTIERFWTLPRILQVVETIPLPPPPSFFPFLSIFNSHF